MAKIKKSHRGRLHRALHVPAGKKIPLNKLHQAAHSKNAHLRSMAQFDINMNYSK